MPFYRVMLRGENFVMNLNGEPRQFGFYTRRFVRARSENEAEHDAVALIKNDESLKRSVLNHRDDPPMIYLEEMEKLPWWRMLRRRRGRGYALWESEEDAATADSDAGRDAAGG